MYCMWYILYSMHYISCAWSACKNYKIVLPSLGGGADVVDTMCSASYCGCSSSPTSCSLYLFGPCLLFHHPDLFVLLYYHSFLFSISIFILSYNPLFFPPSHFFLSPFHYVHVKPCQLSPSVTSSSPHIFLMSNPLFYSIIHPTTSVLTPFVQFPHFSLQRLESLLHSYSIIHHNIFLQINSHKPPIFLKSAFFFSGFFFVCSFPFSSPSI